MPLIDNQKKSLSVIERLLFYYSYLKRKSLSINEFIHTTYAGVTYIICDLADIHNFFNLIEVGTQYINLFLRFNNDYYSK